MKSLVFLGAIFAVVLSASITNGQSAAPVTSESQIRKIVTVPQLILTNELIASGLGGNVRVKVTVDDGGNVTSAEDVTGPGSVCSQVTRSDVVAMRNAATDAAMNAKFEPAPQQMGPFTTWLNFQFPGEEELSDFKAAPAEPASDGTRYTVKPDPNYVAEPPPPNVKTSDVPPPAPVKAIGGGVLNGKGYELPKPPYPAAARAVRASGAVSIQVLIDENGNVFSARAVSGHPLLRAASATAACGSRFSPTRLAGHPVRVAGIITYNFVP